MARKPDADIAWRARNLGQALRDRVGADPGVADVDVAMMHLSDADPCSAALAHAVFRASTLEIDTNSEAYRARMLAAQSTRKLAHAIRAWSEELAPVVADNLRRAERHGATARNFTAHEIPDRVAHVCSIVEALDALASLLAQQLYYPEMVPTGVGKPTEFVLNDITQLLADAGFSVEEIASLTDAQPGDKIKRVRHRLSKTGPQRSRVVRPLTAKKPVKRGKRAATRPNSARR